MGVLRFAEIYKQVLHDVLLKTLLFLSQLFFVTEYSQEISPGRRIPHEEYRI